MGNPIFGVPKHYHKNPPSWRATWRAEEGSAHCCSALIAMPLRILGGLMKRNDDLPIRGKPRGKVGPTSQNGLFPL